MRDRIRPSVFYSHLSSLLFNAFLTLTTGVFLNDYLLRIGFHEQDIGILYAFYYLTGFLIFPASFAANAIRRKKAFFVAFHLAALLFFALFIAAPYLPGVGARGIVWISIGAMGLFSLASGIGRLVLMPWLYGVVGSTGWPAFFRFRLILAYAVPVAFLGGFGHLLQAGEIRVLSGLFLLALALAGLAVVCMGLFPEPPGGTGETREEKKADPFFVILREMAGSKGFAAILAYCAALSFGIGLITPVVYPYLITKVGMDSSHLSVFQIVMTVTSIVSTYGMIRVCQRRGSIAGLVRISMCLWIVPVVLFLLPYSASAGAVLLFALGVADGYGIIFTGTFIALTNVSLEYTPHQNKTVYLAFIEWIKALFMSVGSYLGGWMAGLDPGFVAGSGQIDGYHAVFGVSLAVMTAALSASLRMQTLLR